VTFMLFETPAQQEADPSEAHESGTTSLVERVAQSYSDGLQQAIEDVTLLESLQSKTYGPDFTPFSDVVRSIPCVNQLQKNVFSAIVGSAKKTGLAAPGVYQIEQDDFDQYLSGLNCNGGYERSSTVKTDILGLCKAIEAKYGGEAGVHAERRRAALSLISELDLAKTEIIVKAGLVEFRMRMWLRKNYSGRYEWEYSNKNRLNEILRDLELVFENAGMDIFFPELKQALAHYSTCVVEPGKTSFEGLIADHPIRVKVQKEHLRWRFTKECTDVLSDFVSKYGSE
jgi:hypothetical protein